MKNRRIVTALVLLIVLASTVATSFGIFSTGGSGQYEHESIRGERVMIYGRGLYQQMLQYRELRRII